MRLDPECVRGSVRAADELIVGIGIGKAYFLQSLAKAGEVGHVGANGCDPLTRRICRELETPTRSFR